MYQKIWARVKALKLDDDDETACNEVNAQFSDKELRFLMARNRSKCAALYGFQLGLTPKLTSSFACQVPSPVGRAEDRAGGFARG